MPGFVRLAIAARVCFGFQGKRAQIAALLQCVHQAPGLLRVCEIVLQGPMEPRFDAFRLQACLHVTLLAHIEGHGHTTGLVPQHMTME